MLWRPLRTALSADKESSLLADWSSVQLLPLAEALTLIVSEAWPLLIAAVCAGLVDSMGGGGGLITVPMLMTVGVPPQLLLGTNKSLSTLGSLPAVIRYARAGLLPDMARSLWLFLFALALTSAALGAYLSQRSLILSHLHMLIPLLLFSVMAFMLKRWFWDEPRAARRVAQLGPEDREARQQLPVKLLRPGAVAGISAIAFYDGIFGPGTGTFFMTLFEKLGMKTITANAITKILNLASNLGALLWFASQDRVLWLLGISAACFYLCGNYIGAGLVLRQGQKLVRIVVLLATSGLLIRHLLRYL